jgi:hypothetical protein
LCEMRRHSLMFFGLAPTIFSPRRSVSSHRTATNSVNPQRIAEDEANVLEATLKARSRSRCRAQSILLSCFGGGVGAKRNASRSEFLARAAKIWADEARALSDEGVAYIQMDVPLRQSSSKVELLDRLPIRAVITDGVSSVFGIRLSITPRFSRSSALAQHETQSPPDSRR